MNEKLKKISKRLSYILRHDNGDLYMNKKGWVNVKDLLLHLDIEFSELEEIVETNDKKRFSFDDAKLNIKANQGHSIKFVELDLNKAKPNQVLYHGTKESVKDIILKEGIKPMSRTHVHLSKDIETAKTVANRRKGKSIIFEVDARRMYADGITFYLSENGVWLTDYIDPRYLSL